MFLVAGRAEESTFAAWKEDGIEYVTYAPARPPDLAPAPSPSSRESAPAAMLGLSNMVRVDIARLDELMLMVGELVISRSRLDDGLRRLEPAVLAPELRGLQETNLSIERQLRDLREGVMRVRMVPIREVFARMQFVVRDLTREVGKRATLELSGQDTEVDKFVVERMLDPLLHLVRNAVSHAAETPDERTSRGKSPEGKIAREQDDGGDDYYRG